MTLSVDPEKIVYFSEYDALKNRDNGQMTFTFSGTFTGNNNMNGSTIQPVNFFFSAGENIIGDVHVNLAGSPNNSARWFDVQNTPSPGLITLGGVDYAIITRYYYNLNPSGGGNPYISVSFFVNGHIGTDTITNDVTMTFRFRTYTAPFLS